MDWIEAIILGIVQGLTEFLPVSSSGHLEIGKFLFGIDPESSFAFSVALHGATVASTLVVLWSEIWGIVRGSLKFSWNKESQYLVKIIVSMVPVALVGFLLEDKVEALFNGSMIFIGSMLIITSLLLLIASYVKEREREISFLDAMIIGIAQALAVIPGISRSGATISTGLILGNKRSEVARFSFLMVLVPVIGANFMQVISGGFSGSEGTAAGVIIAGSLAAFVSGYLACRWMISLVREGKIIWFSIYCFIAGMAAIFIG